MHGRPRKLFHFFTGYENIWPEKKANLMRGHTRGSGSIAKRIPAMKSLRLIALSATLALLPHAADAASRHHKGAPAAPSRAAVRQPQEDTGRYYVPNITDAAGNPVPIMQIPGSVVVVPRQVMDDQQDISVCGALRNVSGVFCR